MRAAGCPAKCHVLSCSPCLLRCFAVPFVHIVPPPRSFLLRSVCPAAGWRRDPLSRVFACGRGRVFAPARFARLIARARQPPGAPLPAGVAECHVLSWSPCLLRCFAIPFLHIVPPPRLVLLRSVCPAAGWRRDPLSRVFACGRGRVFAPARFARLIARARQPPGAPLSAGVAECHVLSCSPCLLRCLAVPFLHIVPPPRLVLLRSVCPAAGWWRDPLPRAFAPVRFARLIAPAREPAAGRTPPLRSRRGFFAAPAALLRRKRKGGPGNRLSSPFYHISLRVKHILEQKLKIPEFFSQCPAADRTPAAIAGALLPPYHHARNKSGHDEKRIERTGVDPSFDSTGPFKTPFDSGRAPCPQKLNRTAMEQVRA